MRNQQVIDALSVGKFNLSLQRVEGPLADGLDRTGSSDTAVLRCPGTALGSPGRVVIHQRPGLRLINLQALAHGFLAVVITLDQRLAGDIIVRPPWAD